MSTSLSVWDNEKNCFVSHICHNEYARLLAENELLKIQRNKASLRASYIENNIHNIKRQAIYDYLKLRGTKERPLSTETDIEKIIDMVVKGGKV